MKKIKLQSTDQHQFDCYEFIGSENSEIGLIILHEIFGLTDHIKSMCRLWAQKGYRVLAPALYDRFKCNLVIPYTEEGYKQALDYKQRALNWDQQLSDIDSAKNYLHHNGVTKIVVMGYSWGGTLSWLSACRLGNIFGAISYYGTHINQFKNEMPGCPCLLHFADQDDLVPQNHIDAIKEQHPAVETIIHHATHGFRCEDWQGGNGQEYNSVASARADQLSEKFITDLTANFHLSLKL